MIRVLAPALALSAACSNNEPAGPDDDVPVGIEIHLNGALVTRISGTEVEGFLHVHVGEYSGQFIISPINGAGNPIVGGTFQLGASVDDPAIATFVQPSPGVLEGEIVATTVGTTHLVLQLRRSGTVAFQAPPVEVIAAACAVTDGPTTAPDRTAGCVQPPMP
jgi:hypothetical protein